MMQGASLLIQKAWGSPTITTLCNTASKVVSMGLVLLLILHRFTPADVSLFCLFASIVSLQLLVMSVLAPMFARFISHALAGMPAEELGRIQSKRSDAIQDTAVDYVLVARIVGTLRRIFLISSLVTLLFMAVVGTALLRTPIAGSSDPEKSWAAWVLVVVVTPLLFYTGQFSSVLQGTGHIAQEQRWTTVFNLFGAVLSVIVLVFSGGLLSLIVVTQLIHVASFFRQSWLASLAMSQLPVASNEDNYSATIFTAIWPNAWRSVLGVAIYSGMVYGSGLVFAQKMTAEPLAEFLIGLRIMAVVSEFSRSPFYSQLPRFNRLRAAGNLPALRQSVQKSMIQSHAGFVILFFLAPATAILLLPLIKSTVSFPSLGFWGLLGLAVFVERWGAMHLQVYSTTNDIIWHWLNGATGILWFMLTFLLTPVIGIYSYPVGMLLAVLLVYAPIAVQKSMKSLGCSTLKFEFRCMLPAFCSFSACYGCLWLIHLLLLRPTL